MKKNCFNQKTPRVGVKGNVCTLLHLFPLFFFLLLPVPFIIARYGKIFKFFWGGNKYKQSQAIQSKQTFLNWRLLAVKEQEHPQTEVISRIIKKVEQKTRSHNWHPEKDTLKYISGTGMFGFGFVFFLSNNANQEFQLECISKESTGGEV